MSVFNLVVEFEKCMPACGVVLSNQEFILPSPGEHPAAMQTGCSSILHSTSSLLLLTFLTLIGSNLTLNFSKTSTFNLVIVKGKKVNPKLSNKQRRSAGEGYRTGFSPVTCWHLGQQTWECKLLPLIPECFWAWREGSVQAKDCKELGAQIEANWNGFDVVKSGA